MCVPGLTIETVTCMEDVNKLIECGKQNRSTFETAMNASSSRSHFVLSVYVDTTHLTKREKHSGKLHLVDLAGSERLSSSGAKGDRLKEAQNINKSLSALGDVIQALKQKSQHVPFRNSKVNCSANCVSDFECKTFDRKTEGEGSLEMVSLSALLRQHPLKRATSDWKENNETAMAVGNLRQRIHLA